MEELFITGIKIDQVRHLKDFDIPLSDTEKKHLIITGKNGSGKTSLLEEMKELLTNLDFYLWGINEFNEHIAKLTSQKEVELRQNTIDTQKISTLDSQIKFSHNQRIQSHSLDVLFNKSNNIPDIYRAGNFIIAYFPAKRISNFKTPTGINKVNLESKYGIEQTPGQQFIQYIVNLKADRSFAKDDNDLATANKIDEWFDKFESNLFQLFDTNDVKLIFDRETYNFNIVEQGKEPYNFNQLSDGYSSIMNIVSELLMRMEAHKAKNYDMQGVVLIDEIETHLHVELQKKVLPFLTTFFPKIQFIVTTHSPFIITSLNDAVICDLEKRIVTTDLSGYSYETIIESYFDSDKYSAQLKSDLIEYEKLALAKSISDEQLLRLRELEKNFSELPKFASQELAVKLQQIRSKQSIKGN